MNDKDSTSPSPPPRFQLKLKIAPPVPNRARLIAGGVVAMGLACGTTGYFFAKSRLSEAVQDMLAKGLGLATLVALLSLYIALQFARGGDPQAERAARLNGDLLQRLRWKAVLFNAVILALIGGVNTAGALTPVPEPPKLLPVVFLLAFCALNLAWLYGRHLPPGQRRILDDELTELNRARAVSSGFWIFIAMSAVLLGLAALHPPRIFAALPALVAGPIAVASIRFAWLERKAALDG